jgi:hypothetical protein
VPGEVAIADQGADVPPAIRQRANFSQWKPVEVNEPVRLHHIQLHQIEQGGAAGQHGWRWRGGARLRAATASATDVAR